MQTEYHADKQQQGYFSSDGASWSKNVNNSMDAISSSNASNSRKATLERRQRRGVSIIRDACNRENISNTRRVSTKES
jgi:hypothetical protein